jgi:hypothetical protein
MEDKMILQNLTDADIEGASFNDLRDTLKHFRDKLTAVRGHTLYHIHEDKRVRNSADGQLVKTDELLLFYIDEFLEFIARKLKTP